MKKSAVVAIVAFGVMPFYACSNSEQSAYMERSSIEANALEAEQAEQEFAELAAKEAAGEETHGHGKKEGHKTASKAVVKPSKEKSKIVAHHADDKVDKKKQSHGGGGETGHASTTTPNRKVASVAQHGSASSVWVVQLGAFRVKENAEKLTAKLKHDGYPVRMNSMNHSKNGQLFVVALEPTPNKAEAQKWQSDLKAKSFDTNIVIHKD